MKVACLISGGKDSLYACYISKQWGWEISHLIAITPKKLSWMYHMENTHLIPMIAKSIGLPLLMKESNAEKEKELDDLKELIKKAGVEGVVTGAIASEYQRTRIEKICHEINVKSFMPLWHKNQKQLLKEMLDAGFIIVIDAVAAEGLDKSFLGRIIDGDAIAKLEKIEEKYGINVAGEGGEYETLVIDSPMYKKRIEIVEAVKKWDGSRGIYEVKEARLIEKGFDS